MALSFDDNFARIERAILGGCETAADETARLIARDAKQKVPVDYGALKESIHVVSADKSEYSTATQRALVRNPKIERQIADEYPLSQAERGVVHVAVDVPLEYAPYVEHGTGRARPQPFLTPAGEAQRDEFGSRTAQAIRDNLD